MGQARIGFLQGSREGREEERERQAESWEKVQRRPSPLAIFGL